MKENSVIREFFNGKSVFITGATGFIGKVCLKRFSKQYSMLFQMKYSLKIE